MKNAEKQARQRNQDVGQSETSGPVDNIPAVEDKLGFVRLMMVLSSLSPLFALWGVRGLPLLRDRYFLPICACIIVLPNAILLYRVYRAAQSKDTQVRVIGPWEDHKDHLFVYLFAVVLPIYPVSLSSGREVAASILMIILVVFLFWKLGLHYVNIWFALLGFQLFSINAPPTNNPYSGREAFILLSRRRYLDVGSNIRVVRLGRSLYMENHNGS
jgi:hypothetical protein